MPATIIDEYKVFPRIMMLVVTILTHQSVHWYMSLPDPSLEQSGLVSICKITGCFAVWMNKEAKTDRVDNDCSDDRPIAELAGGWLKGKADANVKMQN